MASVNSMDPSHIVTVRKAKQTENTTVCVLFEDVPHITLNLLNGWSISRLLAYLIDSFIHSLTETEYPHVAQLM